MPIPAELCGWEGTKWPTNVVNDESSGFLSRIHHRSRAQYTLIFILRKRNVSFSPGASPHSAKRIAMVGTSKVFGLRG